MSCRLALCGCLAAALDPDEPPGLAALRVYKTKQRAGSVERVARDGRSAVCRGMFKKETDLSAFTGMQVIPTETFLCYLERNRPNSNCR